MRLVTSIQHTIRCIYYVKFACMLYGPCSIWMLNLTYAKSKRIYHVEADCIDGELSRLDKSWTGTSTISHVEYTGWCICMSNLIWFSFNTHSPNEIIFLLFLLSDERKLILKPSTFFWNEHFSQLASRIIEDQSSFVISQLFLHIIQVTR